MRPVPVVALTVRQFRRVSARARLLTLDLRGAPFRFDAGQSALVGREHRKLRKPYSMASAPEEAALGGVLEFIVGTDADGLAGRHLDGIRGGSVVIVEGPIGSLRFPRRVTAPQLLFVAGGTGIAPVRSMIRHAIASGYGGQITLAYSVRTTRDFAALAEFKHLARSGHLELALTVTREAPARWRGGHGRFTAARLKRLVAGPGTLTFVCGPPSLVTGLPRVLVEAGVAASRIRVERW
jgi:NAD(P)H-flavin reductase